MQYIIKSYLTGITAQHLIFTNACAEGAFLRMFIDRKAGEIIHLVMSVRPSVWVCDSYVVHASRGIQNGWAFKMVNAWLCQVQHKRSVKHKSREIYLCQSKVFVSVCDLLLFRQVARLRSITLLIFNQPTDCTKCP